MARKPRIEFAGATYHVMCRGNRQAPVFRDGRDNEMFLDALGEACVRCGWRVHAFVLMGNHYHLLLETPEPNLVAGMQWLQGTYTKRFNVRHKEWGHLFQGRYKALLVDGAGDYFSTVADYIHLNPARVRGFDFERTTLEEYVWSSYPGYLKTSKRVEWLCVERVLMGAGVKDTSAGRRSYQAMLTKRMVAMQHCSEPWKVDEAWDRIRRGWCLGDRGFRKEMLKHLDGSLEAKERTSFSGEEVRQHDELEAERVVGLGMQALGIADQHLVEQTMGSPEKIALAWLVRKHTCVRNGWIKKRLNMGTATRLSESLKRVESAGKEERGYEVFQRIKSIKL